MTGRDLALAAILADRLRVQYHPDTGIKVLSFHRAKGRWLRISPQLSKGRWRINYGPRKQPVYLNVLVWMSVHRRLPQGNIDHKDGDRLNDIPDNLQEHSVYASNKQGREVQADKELRSASAFFGFIQFWGHEPEPEESVPDWYADYSGPAMITVLQNALPGS